MNKYEFYSKLLQEDFPVQYRQDFAEHDSEQRKKIRDLKEQLAESVRLLRNVDAEVWPTWGDSGSQAAALHEVKLFLARRAQAEQREAREPVLARPEHAVRLDEALAMTMDRYSGALDKLAVIEHQEAQGDGE